MLSSLPMRNRVFWLDPALGEPTLARTRKQLEVFGGRVHDKIDLRLDYLVLDDARRSRPGITAAELEAEAISGGSIATLYLTDITRLMTSASPLVAELLRRGQSARDHWEALLYLGSPDSAIDLAGADLSGLDLSDFRFFYCNFHGANLARTILDNVHLRQPRGLDLRSVASCRRLRVTGAEDCTFDTRDMSDVTFDGPIRGCSFRQATFAGLNLLSWQTTDLTADAAIFHRADMLGVSLHGGRFRGTVFVEAGLDHADLSDADLTSADLHGATLYQTNLKGALLAGANLRQADLRGAQLETAALAGADLTAAEYDRTTIFPPDFHPDRAGMLRRLVAVMPAPAEHPPPETSDLDLLQQQIAHDLGSPEADALFVLAEHGYGVLATEVQAWRVSGVLSEPGNSDRLYCCRLTSEGNFVCGTDKLVLCGRRRRGYCGHLALLLLTLVQRGQLDPLTALDWLHRGYSPQPRPDRPTLAAILTRFTPTSPDYRPTETLPEDYYAL
jgi:uncharacterized protein YjbI with pentapeptide repeats